MRKHGYLVLLAVAALCLGFVLLALWPSEPAVDRRGTDSCEDAVEELVDAIESDHMTASAAVTAAQEAADTAAVRACLGGGRQT
ncbi:hypothetical protein CLV30_1386 [Haloactinopolyspora alba]|uniref:Uncharacterized protein n=1 Tax=Haloactinopolyspora alba TaxID=648780 RepID=A0A2P8D039_9ACTN|nr:hypothetical protein [Haloactinopolyspora alba]PSK90581.1 hypothetical protein CLV30_1386 [Haloactinopolyspora alba]